MKYLKILILSLLIFAFSVLSTEIFVSKRVSTAAEYSYGSSAKGMIVLEVETGKVIAEKNADAKMKMASTTKVLTAITAIESGKDLDAIIKIPAKAVGIEGSSIYLKAGEEITLRNLLYGLMLRSGNDSAVAIALAVGGSVEGFADMMNEKAKQIGAMNSNFVNPHGLDHNDHYTTARDLGKISSYAMMNETFKEIVSSKTHKIPANNISAERFLFNKNKILRNVKGGIGVKTGFTKKAGRCLVSAAEREGLTIVTVVLNCGPMFEESSRLLETAFMEYKMYRPELQRDFTIPVLNGQNETALAFAESEFKQLIKANEEKLFSVEVCLIDNLTAPVKAGSEAGVIKILKDNILIKEIKILVKTDVLEVPISEKEVMDIIKELGR